MAKSLPPDFPGLAALEAAGEATPAKIRKRIANDTLTEIPQIGPAHAEQIKTAFEEFDNPDVQAEDQRDAEGADGKPSDTRDEGLQHEAVSAARDDEFSKPAETHLNTGTDAADVKARSDAENQKPGTVVNQELDNHALDRQAGASTATGVMGDAERLVHCGAVYVDGPIGTYASRTPVKVEARDGRVTQLPIAHVSPRTGMEIHDGNDVYALAEGFGRDTSPQDWLRVRSPNTGLNFIRAEEIAAEQKGAANG
jgi:hypothetical protein